MIMMIKSTLKRPRLLCAGGLEEVDQSSSREVANNLRLNSSNIIMTLLKMRMRMMMIMLIFMMMMVIKMVHHQKRYFKILLSKRLL